MNVAIYSDGELTDSDIVGKPVTAHYEDPHIIADNGKSPPTFSALSDSTHSRFPEASRFGTANTDHQVKAHHPRFP